MQFSQKLDIAGVIMPNNWDENGRIIEVALYTDTEEVYPVEPGSIAQTLMNFMHQKVEIKGKIKEHPDGKKLIAVQNYTVLDETVDDE